MKFLPKYSVENPVVVNIVLLAVLIGGGWSAATMVREMFPESRPKQVRVTTLYPGATPQEVERGIALRYEEAIRQVEDVDKIETTITEGACTILVSMESGYGDLDRAVNDIKAVLDAIPAEQLPEEAEETTVARFEPRLPVISTTIYGDVDEHELKRIGEKLRSELLRLPSVTDVELGGTRKPELTVEVAPEKLVEYGVSLAQIADAIRQANLDLPAGQVKTSEQNIAVRTLGETDEVDRIADTIVRSTASGQVVRVRDLGAVRDAFVDNDVISRFRGHPAVSVTAYKSGDEDAVEIANTIKAYVAGKQHAPFDYTFKTRLANALGRETVQQEVYKQAWRDPYPPTVEILAHSNLARFIESRLELLTRNGAMGLVLVFASLLLFLNWRVAFWVMMGLVFAVCGTAILMTALGVTLNLITMFGLIVVLGLIVDDAIVVGENIYARVEAGEHPHDAAIRGAQEVTWPVIVAVTTTIGAFAPLKFIEGKIGDFMGVLPVIVSCALAISLFESLTILPSHLAEWLHPSDSRSRRAAAGPPKGFFGRLRAAQVHFLQDTIGGVYERALRFAVSWRYVTLAAVIFALLVAVGESAGGRVPFVFVQKLDAETLTANVEMAVGTPVERTADAMRAIEQAADAIPEIESVWTIAGAQVQADEGGATATARSHLGQAIIELKTVENRDRSSEEIINELRNRTQHVPGVNALRYASMQGGPAGAEISLEVTGDNFDDILAAAETIKTRLGHFAGVYDIDDDYEAGRREVQLELLDAARPLGLTTRMLATEVRGAFLGLEARTLQRGRDDVDIRVRFPEDRRAAVHVLEDMRVITPDGRAIPIGEVARIDETRGTASIRRVDQRRAVVVNADVDQAVGNAEQILGGLTPELAALEQQYPGMQIRPVGNKREMVKSLGSLARDFPIALLLIYFMLACLFRSYVQPLVVLSAVPFGITGAIAGHWLMGYPLTILSLIGIVALSGIVVNDALVLVAFINDEVRAGRDRFDAVIAASVRRLRPIVLTSVTTILGLAPLMAEQSFQARFLIPMAISLSFGLAFATVLTLGVVPATYLIVGDIQDMFRRIWNGPAERAAPEPS